MANKWAKGLLIIVLTWIVMISCQAILQSEHLNLLPNLFGGGQQAERKETLTHASAGLTELVVESKNGNITLIGGNEGDDITIEARYHARAASKTTAAEKVEQMTTRIAQSEDRLVIRAVFKDTPLHESISYTITLSPALKVQAKTSNGSLEVHDLSEEITLITSNGRITVTSEQGPKNLVASTSNGSITLNTVPEKGGHYNLRTSNGSVRVKLPEELGVSLNARTSNGSINLGAGEWSFEGGRPSRNRVEAQRGEGEFQLDIVTSNGSITLQDD